MIGELDLVKKVTVSLRILIQKVTFASRYLSENRPIGFDKPVPEGTVVKTIDEKGLSVHLLMCMIF